MNFVLDTGVVAVIVGLVQVAKVSGLSVRWAPLLAVVLGLVVDMVFKTFLLGAVTLSAAAFIGIVSGLSACGLYSGVATTVAPSVPVSKAV